MAKVIRIIPLLLVLFFTIFLISQKNLKKADAQTTTSCGVEPADVVMVIDRSGSMNDPAGTSGTKLSHAKSSAKIFVDKLSKNPKNRAGLSSFATQATIDANVSNDWANIKTKITGLTAGGDTCAECGIYKGNLNLHKNGRVGFKNVMIFLTDGRANVIQGSSNRVSETTAENAAIKEAKTSFNNDGTQIFTIGLGNNINASFLKEIAKITGGKYYASPTSAELNSIYDQISQIIAKSSISGIVFEDVNGNGIREVDELGLPNWEVLLTKPDSSVIPQMTDGKGAYNFSGLCNGTYTVKQTVLTSYEQTLPTGNNLYTHTINGNSFLTSDFGNKQIAVSPPPSCVSATPMVIIDPDSTAGGVNETKAFAVNVKNNDSSTCQATNIALSSYINESGWDINFGNSQNLLYNPGESKMFILTITPSSTASDGLHTITISAEKPNSPVYQSNIGFDLNNPSVTSTPQSPTPGLSGTPLSTKLNMKIGIDGIGTTNKIAIGGNKNPNHTNRNLTVRMYSATDNTPADIFQSHTFTYNPNSEKFEGTLIFNDNFQSGIFNVFVEGPQVLRARIPGSITLTRATTNTAPNLELVTGDINKIDMSNNNIDLNDYNILISCSIYSQDRSACDLNPDYQTYADLNDNGIVDEDDFTLWLKEVTNQGGAQLPQ